jgi:enoyl-CoA hydratase
MLQEERHGTTAVVRLAHGKASAMDVELLRALREAFARLAADPGMRAIVLTGTGSIFCAGLDLRRLLDGGRPYIAELLPALEDCVLELFACEKPVVAALNGHAIAGGCVLACGCDVRLLAFAWPGLRSPKLGVPELKVGVPFPPAVLETVRYPLTPAAFQALALRGQLWDGEEALARGLVDELVLPAELLSRGLAVAAELGAFPAASFAHTKRLARAVALERARTTSRATRDALVAAWSSDEVLGAVRGYVEATLGAR